MGSSSRGDWKRTTKKSPCPICDKPDYCVVSADGGTALCMRTKSAKPSKGKAGGWLHAIVDAEGKKVERVKLKKKPVPKKPVIDWSERAKLMHGHCKGYAVRYLLASELGISQIGINSLGVGVGEAGKWSSWPERKGNGKVCGIVRRYPDGRKLAQKWSSHGVYFERRWAERLGPVFIPEGGSDTAALIGMELSAIGRPSNLGGVDIITAMLRSAKKYAIVLGERDWRHVDGHENCRACNECWPGLYGAEVVAERLTKALRRRAIVRFPPRKYKDVREWISDNKQLVYPDFLSELEAPPK